MLHIKKPRTIYLEGIGLNMGHFGVGQATVMEGYIATRPDCKVAILNPAGYARPGAAIYHNHVFTIIFNKEGTLQ